MRTQRLSQWAALRCKDPEFRQFLHAPDEETAANVVRAICKVQSRGELDRDPAAAQRFHQYIRLPFSQFSQQFINNDQE